MPEFGVIFDNDGVLVDSEHFSIQAYQRAISEQGVQLREGDTERNCGLTDADIIHDMQERYGGELDLEKFSARKTDLYRELAAEGEMGAFSGARELLSALHAEGVPYILASSGSREKIAFNLERSGLADVVPLHLSGEDFSRGKPDPEIFVRAAEKLGVRPEHCVVIEDSINGLKAARAAGAHAVGITNTFPEEKLRPHADTIVHSLVELSPVRLRKLLHGA